MSAPVEILEPVLAQLLRCELTVACSEDVFLSTKMCNRYLAAQDYKKLTAAYFKIDPGKQSEVLHVDLPRSWTAWLQAMGHP